VRHAMVMIALLTLTVQSLPFYDLRVSPEEEIRAKMTQIQAQMGVLIRDLKSQLEALNHEALERAHQELGALRWRELWQYLPAYCPLPDGS
jgi:hypothetical protein